jgi:uncharacterized repeat protein (TIGR03803 family)
VRNIQVRFNTLILGTLAFTLFALAAQAQTFSLLYTFTGQADGGHPFAGLVEDGAGNLYGTTGEGGSGTFCDSNCGTVFKLDTSDNETVLHSFGEASTDGEYPKYDSLVLDGVGNLYGTTGYGGIYSSGTIFRLSPTGKETVVPFNGEANGGFPYGGLIATAAETAYGTTTLRGSGCAPYGCGTVFEVNSTGNETVLYSFTGTPDGEYPYAGLVRDASGNLYGTTPYGGAFGAGTVFQVSAAGKETMLYSFCSQSGCTDGQTPYAGLVRDTSGNLYGTTLNGGTSGAGTVFQVSAAGQETVLHSFCSLNDCADGQLPYAGLVRDSAGNLYGTTYQGGTDLHGTVFELDPTGKLTVLYSFTGGADGGNPWAGLLRDSDGNLYGTTYYGGADGFGTVFKIAP